MTLDTLRDEALELQSDTVALRRALHERPEVGNDLPITRERVLESLDGLPLDLTLHETTAPANHSNLVTFDEDAMSTGVEMYAQMALRHLGVEA